jgi:hypothetical protein
MKQLQFTTSAVTMITVGMLLAIGCGQYQTATDKSWVLGNCDIHEKIQRSKNDWPDPTFLRTYWLERDGHRLTVGNYENESSTGVITGPFAVGEYVLIPTSCYVYRVGPGNQVNEFYPWKATQWHRFSESLRINGAYDYHVDTVAKVDGVWRLTYALVNDLDGHHPKYIHFTTKDDWQSFQIEKGSTQTGNVVPIQVE